MYSLTLKSGCSKPIIPKGNGTVNAEGLTSGGETR